MPHSSHAQPYTGGRIGLGWWAFQQAMQRGNEERDRVLQQGGMAELEQQSSDLRADLDRMPPSQLSAATAESLPELPAITPCGECQSEADALDTKRQQLDALAATLAQKRQARAELDNVTPPPSNGNMLNGALWLGRHQADKLLADERIEVARLEYNLAVAQYEGLIASHDQCAQSKTSCPISELANDPRPTRQFSRTYQHFELLNTPMSRLALMDKPYNVLAGKTAEIHAFLNGQSTEVTTLLCNECDRLNNHYQRKLENYEQGQSNLEARRAAVTNRLAQLEALEIEREAASQAQIDARRNYYAGQAEASNEASRAWEARRAALQHSINLRAEYDNLQIVHYVENTRAIEYGDLLVPSVRYEKYMAPVPKTPDQLARIAQLEIDMPLAIQAFRDANEAYKQANLRQYRPSSVSKEALDAIAAADRRFHKANFDIDSGRRSLKREREQLESAENFAERYADDLEKAGAPLPECRRIQCEPGAAYNPPSPPAPIFFVEVVNSVSGFNPFQAEQVQQLNRATVNPSVSGTGRRLTSAPMTVDTPTVTPTTPTTPTAAPFPTEEPATPAVPEVPEPDPLIVSTSGTITFSHGVGTSPCPQAAGSIQISSNNGNPLRVSGITLSGALSSRLDSSLTGNNSATPSISAEFNCSSADNGNFTGTLRATITDSVTDETWIIGVDATGQVDG